MSPTVHSLQHLLAEVAPAKLKRFDLSLAHIDKESFESVALEVKNSTRVSTLFINVTSGVRIAKATAMNSLPSKSVGFKTAAFRPK